MYDVIIIGSGPAGLSASIYAKKGRTSCNHDRKELYERRTGIKYL